MAQELLMDAKELVLWGGVAIIAPPPGYPTRIPIYQVFS